MSEGFSFYAVKKELLHTTPKGVQEFVKDFFEQKEIFGTECYVAIEGEYKYPWYGHEDDKEYQEGLNRKEIEDCGIFSWFNNHPEIVFEYFWS